MIGVHCFQCISIQITCIFCWRSHFSWFSLFYQPQNEALIHIPITPACTTCCKPLFCPTLSGCWSCWCWHVCVCFPGVSLLVPHGAVTENVSWEMYMVINQGEARWGQSLPKYHFKHLSVCLSLSYHPSPLTLHPLYSLSCFLFLSLITILPSQLQW